MLALEKGKAGDRYHAVAEEGIPMREIEAVIAKRLALATGPVKDAAEYYGWFQHFASLHNPCSSAWTRQTLSWEPRGTRLLTDLDNDGYFGV